MEDQEGSRLVEDGLLLVSANQAAGVFNAIVAGYQDYLKVVQVEETKRTEIHSRESVELAKILARRDALLTYLDRSFDERRDNFDQFFRTLDQAAKDNQPELAGKVLDSIVDLAKSSPFKVMSAADVRRFLADPDAELEVEF